MIPEIPSEQWQHQATAFLARCRAQMWGKHKEEPLSWMFRAGFTVAFSEKSLFGWNFRPMSRNAANWLGPDHEGEKFLLPSGLVLPWVHEQKILRLSMVLENGESLVLPGSSMDMMEAGEGSTLLLVFSDGDFFRLAQDFSSEFSIMSAPFADKILEKDLASFERILLVAGEDKKEEKLLKKLLEKGLPVRPLFFPGKELLASILEKRLTDENLLRMVSATM